ncbi:MAG TPA: serine/threonine-protein kinase [Terriglobales bacterium]|nr:serine/threonine-protein kinase [Terriglobales bacterium]
MRTNSHSASATPVYNGPASMPLTSGTKLGPYEIQSPIGAGGMGEVYRARDIRLAREVAIKILPEAFARDPDRLQRFEHEARVLSTVNHPNILAIHDVGAQDHIHYLVSELLEGQTLREKMNAGPLSQRRVTEYAVEMARGLAAAHEKGIVHRDFKPDNVFITKDGRIKILDFGLAKLAISDGGSSVHTATMSAPDPTQPGTVMGTVGYMSPEQVRGKPLDYRSDLFSFGAILYEMLSGKRAFKGDSGVETMNAILKEDPPDLGESGLHVTPGLDRIVRHCLEKEPAMRFQSARDLAFDLESLSSLSSSTKPAVGSRVSSIARYRTPLLIALPVLLLVAAAAFWAGHASIQSPAPLFTRLTFRGGHVSAARFSPDGHTIVYSAAFGDEPLQIYTTRPDAPQSRELGLKNSSILAISKQDELAITLNHTYIQANAGGGTLARLPLTGGSPRELNEAVGSADWAPDGQSLALARLTNRAVVLEYPQGKTLYETQGWVDDVRISPDGNRVAFVEHPIRWDSLGTIAVVDREGKRRQLTGSFSDVRGLAWGPSGKEIWFTGSNIHLSSNLFAVDLDGHQRLVWAGAGGMVLQDVISDGRVLFIRENRRRGIAGLFPGHDSETDLSWQDWSLITRISPDGKWIFFSEEGDGGGQKYSAYMRATDGSPAIRLGDGTPWGLSPDLKWVASIIPGQPQQLWLLPTHAGEPKNLSRPDFDYDLAVWLPDGQHLMITGRESGKQTRSYVCDMGCKTLTPVTPEGVQGFPTEDGKEVVSRQGDVLTFYPISGGQPRTVIAKIPNLAFPQSGNTGRYVIGAGQLGVPMKLYRYNTLTGEKKPWKELVPPDRVGVFIANIFDVTPDLRWYAYSYVRDLSDLYMVEGLR